MRLINRVYPHVMVVLVTSVLVIGYFNLQSLTYIPSKNPHATPYQNAKTILSALNQINHLQENNFIFSKQVTHLFHLGIHHYWTTENNQLAINFNQNWSLALLNRITAPNNASSEFVDYRNAIQRGIGLCSQNALAIQHFMQTVVGAESRVISLNGHVVNETRFDNGETFVLDGDYDVVLPFSLKVAHDNPQRVEKFYTSHGYDRRTAKLVAQIYTHQAHPYGKLLRIKWVISALFNWVSWVVLLVCLSLMYRKHNQQALPSVSLQATDNP